MKPNIQLPDRESRFLTASVELRAAADTEEPKTVFGYAAKFDTPSENLGSEMYQIREIIKPGAFDDVLNDDVRALFNHESSAILARSKNGKGSLRLGVDEVGLFYEFEAPDTQVGRDLVTSLKRGDVDQSSFSFTVAKSDQEWASTQEGEGPEIHTRTIHKVTRLFDVSPVTYPAYPDATVALRSLEDFQKQTAPPEPEPTEEHSLSHWQRRLGLIDKTASNTTNA
jgi:HK97 family phage prohead protease